MSAKPKPPRFYDANGCRWEKSKYPHPKFPAAMRGTTLLPDVIYLRFHTVFRGELLEEVTGWQSSNPAISP